LQRRVYDLAPKPPLEGITEGGYGLVYTDQPTSWWKSNEKNNKMTDLTYSGGLVINSDGKVTGILWDSPAFNAGIAIGDQIVAVNSRTYDADDLKHAIKEAAGRGAAPELLIKGADLYRSVKLDWHAGLRYPRLEKVSKGEGTLDALLAPH
jgi:predicted metalloprotease with PDZ domain